MIAPYNTSKILQAMPSYNNSSSTAATPLKPKGQASVNVVASHTLSVQTTCIELKNQSIPRAFAQFCALSRQTLEPAHLEKSITHSITVLQPELVAIYPPFLLKLLSALHRIKIRNPEIDNFITELYCTLRKYLPDYNVEHLIYIAESMIKLNTLSIGFIEDWSQEIMLRLNLNGMQYSRCYAVLDFLEKKGAALLHYPIDRIRKTLKDNLFRAHVTL